jgi:glucose uptake protein GlcU
LDLFCCLLVGFLWNICNVFALMAIPIVGYAIAYPIVQCAILVAGVWGVVVFKEISGNAVKVFFMSSILVLLGAVFLSLGFYL